MEADVRVVAGDGLQLPLGGEQADELVELVSKTDDAGAGPADLRQSFRGAAGPAGADIGQVFERGVDAVLLGEARFDHVELQAANGAENGFAADAFRVVVDLDNALFGHLGDAFAELLGAAHVRVTQDAEELGLEAGDAFELDGGVGAEGIADDEHARVDDADNVAGEGHVEALAVAGEEAMGAGHAELLVEAGVVDEHVAVEAAGADAEEGHAVAVHGVHVALDFEDEGGEVRRVGFDEPVFAEAGHGGGGEFGEGVEEAVDAEVVEGAAEEDGGLEAEEEAFAVEGGDGDGEESGGVGELGGVVGADGVRKGGIVDGHLFGFRADHTAKGALVAEEAAGLEVDDALEAVAVADGPIAGDGGHAEDAFDLIEEFHGIEAGLVHLVDEGQHGDTAHAADFEEFAGLGFDAFGAIEDHDGAVDGGEGAVGIFAEVLVAGGIEEVEQAAAVFELKGGGGDGDAAGLFHGHPVGGGVAAVFLGADGAGGFDFAGVEEKFFGEGGFAGVRVGDDGEGAAAADLFAHFAKGGVWGGSQVTFGLNSSLPEGGRGCQKTAARRAAGNG